MSPTFYKKTSNVTCMNLTLGNVLPIFQTKFLIETSLSDELSCSEKRF